MSLGVHAVLGLEGRLRFGPDAEHLPDREAWAPSVAEAKRDAFAAAVRRLVPAITAEDLEPRHRRAYAPSCRDPDKDSATS